MQILLGSGGISTPSRKQAWIEALQGFLQPVLGPAQASRSSGELLFIPYALADFDAYVRLMHERGFDAGYRLTGIHTYSDPAAAIQKARAIYVGGGNTFRLLDTLYRLELMDLIRERVRSNQLAYIGVSAGSNLAGPTIKTTNDMPIVQPPSFTALGLVPFQINPHYFAGPLHFEPAGGGPLIPYAGETREDRIREFHEMNSTPVVGLWEGAILHADPEIGRYHITGEGGARVFRAGQVPVDVAQGALPGF